MKPRLVCVAALWTFDGHPRPRCEWSLARKVAAVRAAGFDGVTAAATPELAALLRRHGLRFLGFFTADRPAEIAPALAAQLTAGAEAVNVQLGDGATSPARAWALVRALDRAARRAGCPVALETHRDTITETPERTRALAVRFRRETGRRLPLTLDHSHIAVVKHPQPALFTPVLLRPAAEVQAARVLHLRPFNGQHAQVPVTDTSGRLTPEFRDWLGFAEALFRLWLAKAPGGAELWVCPEIGPRGVHGYNLSTMPAAWPQAVRCARELRRVWRRAGGAA